MHVTRFKLQMDQSLQNWEEYDEMCRFAAMLQKQEVSKMAFLLLQFQNEGLRKADANIAKSFGKVETTDNKVEKTETKWSDAMDKPEERWSTKVCHHNSIA